ncbi:YgcG family protein [Pseudomonas sp.]|uniref:TPM domain-containing protein n=1 Tax=Pseudomonas sp. TaxID=306 RepID=UPI0026DB31BC|nr:YgcG family protein [Pseudomonas sp.]MDO4238003.1 YgcG family protein [Pseudomonas sp.]
MMVMLRQSVLSVLVLVLASLLITARADTSPIGVALDQRVIDLTNTLDADSVQRLKQQLADLEQRKGAQVAVLLVPSTGDTAIEDYANQLFRAWKLGRKDVDDGILLVVAKNDHTLRIEVGYGLEGTVTDLLAHRIIEERITPAFRQGDFAGGVQQGVDALTMLVDGGDLPEVAAARINPQFFALLAALVLGGLLGVLLASGKLHWRKALIVAVVATLLLTLLGGGQEWPMFLFIIPFTLLIGGALFGALWQVRALFYGVIGLLVYIAALVVADRYVDVSFIHWLLWPVCVLVVLGLYLVLLLIMRHTWRTSRTGFIVRLVAAVVVYGVAGLVIDHGRDGWLLAFPIASFVALILFGKVGEGSGSGSGGGSGSSSSGSSSGSSSSGSGGSSGGGGASGVGNGVEDATEIQMWEGGGGARSGGG